MATNRVPNKYDLLVALAEDAADGAATHESAIGLLQNTEARIRTDLNALESAQQTFQTARTTSRALTSAQRTADANGKAFIDAAKGVLAPVLGKQWSTAWVATGFITSLEVPGKLAARQTLLAALRDYLTANPANENSQLNVTAAQATALHTALSDARSAVNGGLVDRGQKRSARDLAQRALKSRLGGLVEELGRLLGPNDQRWLAFGLNMPGGETTPDAPSDLVLTLGGPGEVLVDWDDVANADHYRVFKQEVGVDADFVHVGSPDDSDFTIDGLTGGNVLRVKVSAVSGSLEGPTSDVAEITVGGAPAGGVTLSGQWDPMTSLLELQWTASSDPNLQNYQPRYTPGATYDETSDFDLNAQAPGTTQMTTTDGLPSPGSVATYRVYVVLTTGEEIASNDLTIQRP